MYPKTTKNAKGRNRTGDTSIFSAVLYQLSYLGMDTSHLANLLVAKLYHVLLYSSILFCELCSPKRYTYPFAEQSY